MLGIMANSRKRVGLVTMINVRSNHTNSAVSISISVPTHTDGDLLVALGSSASQSPSLSGGWTVLSSSGSTRAWYRIASAEPSSYTLSTGSSETKGCTIYSFFGSSITDISATTVIDSSGGGWMSCPSITVDIDDSYVLRVAKAASSNSLTSITYPLAGTTSRYFDSTGFDQRAGYYFTDKQSAGVLGGHNIGFANTTINSAGITVQVNPA